VKKSYRGAKYKLETTQWRRKRAEKGTAATLGGGNQLCLNLTIQNKGQSMEKNSPAGLGEGGLKNQ